jgi:parallel beta-helix repeat protein
MHGSTRRALENGLIRAACLLALSLTFGCNAAPDSATPTSPGLTGHGGMDVAPQARGVIRVPGDYATIQAAVDAAAPGDTVQVTSGTYCEQVTITKPNLRLHTSPGATRAVITGDCPAVNRLGAGIHVMNATGVEIRGFIIEHFEWGIQLMSTHGSRVHLNEVRFNTTVVRENVPAQSRGIGILLQSAGHNTVSQNDLHDNGRNGITLFGSSGNTIRGNRLNGNNLENGGCNLMLASGSNNNSVVENEILGSFAHGIMIGPGIATGNHVAQNRVHGFPGAGIIAMLSAAGNVIEQNNAKGNGVFDLVDQSNPADNTWSRNQGTCGPGVC